MHILYLFQRRTNYYLLRTVRTVPMSYSYGLANFNKDEKSGISKELLLSSMTMTKKEPPDPTETMDPPTHRATPPKVTKTAAPADDSTTAPPRQVSPLRQPRKDTGGRGGG